MADAFKSGFRVAWAVMAFAIAGLAQPAAAQFNQTVAFTITNAAGETAVPPGCPQSSLSFLNPLRVTRGSLPASDYFCYTGEDDVRGVASYYAPYAIQAALSYDRITDDDTSLADSIERNFPAQSKNVRDLLVRRGWHFRYPDRCFTLGVCGADYQIDPSGLAFQIWSRTNARDKGPCREATIAFRGSVLSIASWGSNFEQQLPGFDSEYNQLKRDFNAILGAVSNRLHCGQIVTVGHSLGGGLAQFVALATSPHHRIAKVVTFNTSPVSGVNLVADQQLLGDNATGLTIDRVNQQGEALSFHFFKKRRQTPASVCDPLIRGVEFNTSSSGWHIPLVSAVDQHFMTPLTSKLVELSYRGEDYVTPKLPPAGKQACNTRYHEEQEEEATVAAAINEPGRFASANTGFTMTQPGQYGSIYAYAADRDGSRGKLDKARTRKNVAMPYGRRVGRVHTARS